MLNILQTLENIYAEFFGIDEYLENMAYNIVEIEGYTKELIIMEKDISHIEKFIENMIKRNIHQLEMIYERS